MILYIIRHAIAEPADPRAQQDDSQRPLTEKGRRRMRKIARGL
jgi:phosphohistidine phosphatase SixA